MEMAVTLFDEYAMRAMAALIPVEGMLKGRLCETAMEIAEGMFTLRREIYGRYCVLPVEISGVPAPVVVKLPADAPKNSKVFVKPTVEEVAAYCLERKNGIDPQSFIDHYEANGWKVGRVAMKSWQAAVRTWERNRKSGGQNSFAPRRDSVEDDESPTENVRYAPGHEPPYARRSAVRWPPRR